MPKEFLEAGRIVDTHGVRGEVRVELWCDGPAFLAGIKTWYIDGRPFEVQNARAYKQFVLAKFVGVGDMNAALALRGQVISVSRADAEPPEGRFFIQDILGFDVVYAATGIHLGVLTDVLSGPQDVYVVTDRQGAERLIPNVPAFVKGVDLNEGKIRVTLIEGL